MGNGKIAMTAHKRSNFTDHQKAEIFVRDRATCAFSGISLWIIDYGASMSYDVDWVDHIKPSARGGKSIIENGICASRFFNSKKKDNGSDNCYFFKHGRPTDDYFFVFEKLPLDVADHLRRFASLETADWYFNRALWHLILAVEWLIDNEEGALYKRGIAYRANAAFRFLKKWRELASDPTTETFQRRNLIKRPIWKDQELMLSLADVKTVEEFALLTQKLARYYKANSYALSELADLSSAKQAEKFLEKIQKSTLISPRIKEIVQHNVRSLFV